MLKILFSLTLIFSFLSPAEKGDPPRKIRVALLKNVESVSIRTSGMLYLLEKKSGDKYKLLPDSRYFLKADGDKVKIDGKKLSPPLVLIPPEGEKRINISSRIYKGEINIEIFENALCLTENIPLEDYLVGVLPYEMSPSWPIEALKAQAVVSRTFALSSLSPDKIFDITNGVERQVYKGMEGADENIVKAVRDTEGEILTYKGKLVKTYFHSCCGGHTASAKAIWGNTYTRPLRGRRDPYCRHSRKYYWKAGVSGSELLRFIHQKGSTALKIRRVRIYGRDSSGRAKKIKFYTETKPFSVKAVEFRKYFGPSRIKSTLITKIRKRKGKYVFYGRGWGHGVGMCQEGAKTLAKKGKSYRSILRFYYPGAKLESIQ